MPKRPVLHDVETDLSETWVEDFAAEGVAVLEDLLGRHARFLDYLARAKGDD